MKRKKKQILDKSASIFGRKIGTEFLLKIVNKKIIIIEVAIVVFVIGFSFGAGLTYWRFYNLYSDSNMASIEYRKNANVSSDIRERHVINSRNSLSAKGNFSSEYNSQNFHGNPFLVFIIKLAMLIALTISMIIISVNFLQIYKKIKRNGTSAHSVKQMAKTGIKAVKMKKIITKKKRK